MKEILLLAAGPLVSAYADHKDVWRVIQPHLKEGEKFLFRRAGDIIKVRAEVADASRIGHSVFVPQDGERVGFRVLVSAAKSQRADDNRKVRVAISNKNDMLQIIRKALSPAFEILHLDGSYQQSVPFGKDGHKVNFKSFEAWGVLKVTDADKCREILKQGIGRARRFGFGMLELEPTQ